MEKSQGVTIKTSVFYKPSPEFNWTASGDINDSGNFEFIGPHWGGSKSPAVGTLNLQLAFTGEHGNFKLKCELTAKPGSEPGVFNFNGPWQLLEGSGDYNGVRGTGKAEIVGRTDQQSTESNPEIGTLTGQLTGLAHPPAGVGS